MTLMPGISSTDPYFILRGEIQDSVHELQQKMSRFHGLMQTNPERKTIAAQVEAGCDSLRWQLNELNGAVEKALQDPSRFNLTTEELSSRRRWIDSTQRQVAGIVEELHTALAQMPAVASTSGRDAGARVREDNSRFMSFETQQQEMMMRQQDQSLDDIEMAVARIGHMGQAMAEELQEHDRLLTGMNEDMDSVQLRLRATQKRILELIRDSSRNTQLCLIVFLSVVLIILTILALS